MVWGTKRRSGYGAGGPLDERSSSNRPSVIKMKKKKTRGTTKIKTPRGKKEKKNVQGEGVTGDWVPSPERNEAKCWKKKTRKRMGGVKGSSEPKREGTGKKGTAWGERGLSNLGGRRSKTGGGNSLSWAKQN